jgi:hypothetical protein
LGFLSQTGAGEESRTLDLNLGKVALYQLSYSRKKRLLYRMLEYFSKRSLYNKKRKPAASFGIWSGRRVSNSRPQPWQGCALPTELLPHSQQTCIIEDQVFLSSASCTLTRVLLLKAMPFLNSKTLTTPSTRQR